MPDLVGNGVRAGRVHGSGGGPAGARLDWLAIDPSVVEAARQAHVDAQAGTEAATQARTARESELSSARDWLSAARSHQSELIAQAIEEARAAQQAAEEAAASQPERDTEAPEVSEPGTDSDVASSDATESEQDEAEGPSAADLAAEDTAQAEAAVASAQAQLASATSAESEAVEAEDVAAAGVDQSEADLAAAEQAAADAAEAEAAARQEAGAEEAAEDLVVGEDISVADTLAQRPEALAAMGLDQYAGRPEVGKAAAEAMKSGDWKALQRAGLSKDEAQAVFNTVEAVRIGVENTSHQVSFEDGTIIDDQVGRDEIVIPGVQSFDELDQTRDGDDLILATAEGEVRVVGFYDKGRGNVSRIRLGDADSDDHADTALYREELLLQDEIDSGEYREKYGINGQLDWWDMDLMLAPGEQKAHRERYKSQDTRLREARNAGMKDWGDSQSEDVRSLMFGASNRNQKEMKRGHRKILNRHYDAKQNYGRGSGAESLAMADKALQDLSFFNSVDDARKEKHLKNIAKKGQKSSFLGKALGFIGAVASFIPGVGQIIGAVATGLSVVVQGGSLMDGIKAGLGSYLAGGGMIGNFGGSALTRVAGSALQSGGDLASTALAFAGTQLDGTKLGDVLKDNHLGLSGNGLTFAPGGGPVSFGVDSDGDFGAGVTVDTVSIDFSEGGELALGVTRDDWSGTITDDGAVSFAQNLGDIAGADTTTWAGLTYDPNTGFGVTGNQTQSELLYDTFRSGTFNLETGQTDFRTDTSASVADILDESFTYDGQFVPLMPTLQHDFVTVPDNQPPGMTAEEVLAEHGVDGPTIDYSAPEAEPVRAHDPAGPMEEVVVVGTTGGATTSGPTPGFSGSSGGGSTEDTRDAGPTAEELERRAKAAGDIAEQGIAAVELATELDRLEANGRLLGAAGLASAGRKLVESLEKAEREVAETGSVSASTAADIAHATSQLRSGLESAVGLPKQFVTRALGTVTGAASDVATLFDERASTLDKVNAALGLASNLVPPTSPVGVAIATFDISTSVGTAAREIALTTPVFDILYDSAEGASASLDAAGDTAEQYLSGAGEDLTVFLESELGVDVGDTLETGFQSLGTTANAAFDSVATVADDIIVIGGSVGATLAGVVWAGIDSVSGDD